LSESNYLSLKIADLSENHVHATRCK